jgi:predicted ATPase
VAEPELLAHHFTQAGLIEAAIEWWGKAGHRSLERSALVEAIEQLTRALGQIAILPTTPALRRAEINLQVALDGSDNGFRFPITSGRKLRGGR